MDFELSEKGFCSSLAKTIYCQEDEYLYGRSGLVGWLMSLIGFVFSQLVSQLVGCFGVFFSWFYFMFVALQNVVVCLFVDVTVCS